MAQSAAVKRFYKTVEVAEADGGWRVSLDGRFVRTPGEAAQIVPTRALAEAMAREWAGQGEEIDTAAFILRDLADYALDVVARDRATIVAELLPYAETDTLCYRADPDEPQYAPQARAWEPVLQAFEMRHGVRFERISGIIHRPQPAETLAALRLVLEAQDTFALAALKTLASLAASLTIALSALDPDADADALWNAANFEEDWQAEQWGHDALAQERRELRGKAFAAAREFALLATGTPWRSS